jgi:hypothetical protein
MLVPLYGFLEGDTLGLVILVQDDQPVSEVARALQEAASMRVPPRDGMAVYRDGQRLDPDRKVAEAGLTPLARVDVRMESGR